MKNLEWKEEVVESKILTLKKAVEISLKKWEYIVENNGSLNFLTTNIPELKYLVGTCGLCQLCSDTNNCNNIYHECYYIKNGIEYDCPLIINGTTCGMEGYDHPWHNWQKNRTKKNAQAVLNLIKKIKIL